MPYRMRSEYLRQLFINKELVEGQYHVGGRPVALTHLHVPIFAVAARTDHVAPWCSVYEIHLLTDAPVDFVSASGGHNAGIVSEPGHPGRSYQVPHRPAGGRYVDPDTWAAATPAREGAWWPAWVAWLGKQSSALAPGPSARAPEAGLPALAYAPGRYVLDS